MASRVKREFVDPKALIANHKASIAEAINSANRTVKSVAQQLAPVSEDGSHGNSPGYLRDHILIIKDATPSDLRAVTESGASYSTYVELGTEPTEAQPYMLPAYTEGKRQLLAELRSMNIGKSPPKSLGIKMGSRL